MSRCRHRGNPLMGAKCGNIIAAEVSGAFKKQVLPEPIYRRVALIYSSRLRTWARRVSITSTDLHFELVHHELLTRLGATLEVHSAGSRTDRCPDFLAASPNGANWYLDAALAGKRHFVFRLDAYGEIRLGDGAGGVGWCASKACTSSILLGTDRRREKEKMGGLES